LEKIFATEREKLTRSHLLLGTVKPDCVVATANFAKENKIPFVSPFTASGSITTENPYYIQINPTLRAHLKALVKHARFNYNSDQILVVVPDNPDAISRMKVIQELNAELAGDAYAPKFEEVIIKDKSPNLDKLNLSTLIRKGRETVFLLPIWENKDFIYAFLRKAYVTDLQNQIVIYGMRQWQSKTFEDMEFSYLENLEVHISSEYFVDGYAPDVREFKRRYFEVYGTSPSQDAFRGYDNMLYFGRMLNKHGTKFYEFFEEEKLPYFHTKYQFEPVTKASTTNIRNEQYGPTERYENGFIHILKFTDFYFQPVTDN
jgi:ABC-type branched-subunit amino acid transport system substrate-binding protein